MEGEFPTAGEGAHTPRGRRIAMTLADLFVMALTKARQGTPYYALAHQFNVSNGASCRLVNRFRDLVNENVGKRLFHLQHADTVRANLPADWPKRFQHTLLIGDGHPKEIKKSGTFIIQRITWSPYKHENIFLWVICEYTKRFLFCVLTMISLLVISPDGLVQMRSRVYGGQSAEVTTIINESALLARIQGDGWSVLIVSFFFTSYRCAEMGYLRPGEGAEPTPVFMYDGAAGRASIGENVSFVVPSSRFKDGARLEVVVFFPTPSAKLTYLQEVSIKAGYEVQSRRLLVERIIRTINEWKVLDDWQADGIEDFEAWLDFVLALCNLQQLEAAGRLDEIPDEEPAGADRRIFSKSEVAALPAVKVSDTPPKHLQLLLDDGPNFYSRKWGASFRPTALHRAKSRVNSCYILQINSCRLDLGAFLVAGEAAASAMGLTYLWAIMVDKKNFFLQHACSCTVGNGSLEDEDEDDERPRRGVEEKGGCSTLRLGSSCWHKFSKNRTISIM